MTNYPIFFLILMGEAAIFLIVVGLIVIHRLSHFIFHRQRTKRKKIITDYIFSLIEQNKEPTDVPYPGKPSWRKALLQVLESFDFNIRGVQWLKIKFLLAREYLVPKARKFARKSSWLKRNFAARAFVFAPLEEDLEIILNLSKDKEYIVRAPASLALITMGNELGIHKALYAIAHEQTYEHYFYQDLLLYKSDHIFDKIIEFAKDPNLHAACLIILAQKSWGKKIPFLQDDLASPVPEIRRLGFKILLSNEFDNRQKHFEDGLQDADEGVVALALQGICNYPLGHLLPKLEELLNHSSWNIRVLAARAIKKAGEQGEHLLQSQKGEGAIAAVKYVADFG